MEIGELATNVSELKKDMDSRFTTVDERFAALEERIVAEGAATRRHFDVVAEKLRTDLTLSMDKAMATGEPIARLTTANLRDHLAIEQALADHEVRLKTLEAGTPTQ